MRLKDTNVYYYYYYYSYERGEKSYEILEINIT